MACIGSLITAQYFIHIMAGRKQEERLGSKMRKELLGTYCMKIIIFLNEQGKFKKKKKCGQDCRLPSKKQLQV